MANLPNDVLQEVFQLLCCPSALPPDYTGLKRPTGFGQGQGADGVEVVDLFGAPKLPTVYQLAKVCRAWRRLTTEIPRIWNYHLILNCTPLLHICRGLQSNFQGSRPPKLSLEELLTQPQISHYIDRLHRLLSTRQMYAQEGGRKDPLHLTVTLNWTSDIPLINHILSILYQHTPQLSSINFVGGWVAPGQWPTPATSSPHFETLEALQIYDPSGTHPLQKLLRLTDDSKPEITFPRLHTLSLYRINLPPLTPHLPWPQLTSLSLGSVGLRYTAGLDSDPDEVLDVLRLTPSLRYLRIHGRMRPARPDNSYPDGQAADSTKHPLVILHHLTHLEIHDMDLTIITSPLFTHRGYKASDKSDTEIEEAPKKRRKTNLPGLLCAPRAKDIGRICRGFAEFLGVGAAGEGEDDDEARMSVNTLHPITLRVAIASPLLFAISRASPTSPTKPTVLPHVIHGTSPSIFRRAIKRLADNAQGGSALSSLKKFLANEEEIVTAGKKRSGEGKVYTREEIQFRPVTDDVVIPERFIDRFVKLSPLQSLDEASSDLSLEDPMEEELGNSDAQGSLSWPAQRDEGVIKEAIQLLAWDGTSRLEVEAVNLDRWLYVLTE
ncbi:hypothetical protein NMY22_g16613 [Coprinellus aureogranulatus]|nr:hypothetical protein NMY22_g16613 [Coprinellus aureogranulatus]